MTNTPEANSTTPDEPVKNEGSPVNKVPWNSMKNTAVAGTLGLGLGLVIGLNSPLFQDMIKGVRAQYAGVMNTQPLLEELKKSPAWANITLWSDGKYIITVPNPTVILGNKSTKVNSKQAKKPTLAKPTRPESFLESPFPFSDDRNPPPITIVGSKDTNLKTRNWVASNEAEYNIYLNSMPPEIADKMPDFGKLLQALGWNMDNSGVRFLLKGDEVWIYWNLTENQNGQKYRLRKWVLQINTGKLDTSLLNKFWFEIEN